MPVVSSRPTRKTYAAKGMMTITRSPAPTSLSQSWAVTSCRLIPASYVLNANPVKSRRQPDSQPTPSKSASKPCGSGGRTVNRRNSISPQSRSGGAGGMQTSYEGEHRSIDRGRGVGTRVGMGGRPSLSSGTGLRSPSLDGGRPSSPSPSGAESSEHAKSASETKATSRIRSIGAIVRSFALTIKPRSGCAVNGCRQTGGGV